MFNGRDFHPDAAQSNKEQSFPPVWRRRCRTVMDSKISNITNKDVSAVKLQVIKDWTGAAARWEGGGGSDWKGNGRREILSRIHESVFLFLSPLLLTNCSKKRLISSQENIPDIKSWNSKGLWFWCFDFSWWIPENISYETISEPFNKETFFISTCFSSTCEQWHVEIIIYVQIYEFIWRETEDDTESVQCKSLRSMCLSASLRPTPAFNELAINVI